MQKLTDLSKFDINVTIAKTSNHLVGHGIRSFKQETRENYGLFLPVRGNYIHEFNGKKNEVKKGDVVLLRKGETYRIIYNTNSPEADYEFYVLSFDVSDSKLKFLKRVNKISRFERYLTLFKEANNYISSSKSLPGRNLIGKSRVYEILYMLFVENYSSSVLTPIQKNIEKAKMFMDENFTKKISMEELAKMTGYSNSYFKKKFKEFYGISPGEYIANARIDMAKDMLETKIYSISEISEKCGFSSDSYFSHAFKNSVGCSPKQYR